VNRRKPGAYEQFFDIYVQKWSQSDRNRRVSPVSARL